MSIILSMQLLVSYKEHTNTSTRERRYMTFWFHTGVRSPAPHCYCHVSDSSPATVMKLRADSPDVAHSKTLHGLETRFQWVGFSNMTKCSHIWWEGYRTVVKQGCEVLEFSEAMSTMFWEVIREEYSAVSVSVKLSVICIAFNGFLRMGF